MKVSSINLKKKPISHCAQGHSGLLEPGPAVGQRQGDTVDESPVITGPLGGKLRQATVCICIRTT